MAEDRLALLARFVALEKAKRDLEARLDAVKEEQKAVEETIFREVFEAGFVFQSITLDGMTVYLHRQLWAGAKQGEKEGLIYALKESGLVDMVSETFNTNTLSAWVRERQQEGGYQDIGSLIAALPSRIGEHITVSEKFSLRTNKN